MQNGFDTSENNGLGNASGILAVVPITQNGFSNPLLFDYEGIPEKRIEVPQLLSGYIQIRLTNQYDQLIELNGCYGDKQDCFLKKCLTVLI